MKEENHIIVKCADCDAILRAHPFLQGGAMGLAAKPCANCIEAENARLRAVAKAAKAWIFAIDAFNNSEPCDTVGKWQATVNAEGLCREALKAAGYGENVCV